ncbi:MAG TPA: hypothetical protein VH394_23395 [Thermoanaerobaculia bacterium]|nr:hypothetical protein [Thermoanaerobaculia bacterium]
MPWIPRRLILALFLAWSALAFLVELSDTFTAFDRRETERADPIRWRFGVKQVEVLEQCLAEARQEIPPGSVVAFASPPSADTAAAAEFYRWRWAAYLLPEDDVLAISDPKAGELARYLIAHRQPIDLPRAEKVRQLTGCVLYRIRR